MGMFVTSLRICNVLYRQCQIYNLKEKIVHSRVNNFLISFQVRLFVSDLTTLLVLDHSWYCDHFECKYYIEITVERSCFELLSTILIEGSRSRMHKV